MHVGLCTRYHISLRITWRKKLEPTISREKRNVSVLDSYNIFITQLCYMSVETTWIWNNATILRYNLNRRFLTKEDQRWRKRTFEGSPIHCTCLLRPTISLLFLEFQQRAPKSSSPEDNNLPATNSPKKLQNNTHTPFLWIYQNMHQKQMTGIEKKEKDKSLKTRQKKRKKKKEDTYTWMRTPRSHLPYYHDLTSNKR